MKKLIMRMILILMVILCVGCNWTPEQHSGWQNYWQNYGQQQQNLANQQNMQLRDNAQEINRQLRRPSNDSYWQERRAQQEWQKEQDDYYRRMRLGLDK